MQVRLVSYSKPSEALQLFDHAFFSDSIQNLIAYCARVSNPENQNSEKTKGLIKYLIKHKHWSPLEMVNICLEIETTRDIARQILRHRSFSFQEYSQRYANPTEDLEFITRTARLQDPKNRQNSIETHDTKILDTWEHKQLNVIEFSKKIYEWAIKNGIAKEQARAVLPEGLIMSRMYMNGTLRSWVHYIDLRSGHGTQKEHMEVAKACAVEIMKIFPLLKEIGEQNE